jgi:hypothetical protein
VEGTLNTEQPDNQATELLNNQVPSNGAIQPSPEAEEHTSLTALFQKLTPKNRLFIMLIGEGRKTLQAYREAGYEGKDHAAYELRSYLGDVLEKYLAARGFDKATLMSEMSRLVALPISESVKEVDVKTKLKILSEFNKMIPKNEEKKDAKKITAIQINVGAPRTVTPPPGTTTIDV